MGKLKIWTPEEDQLLSQISSQHLSKKWKKASEELKKNGYQRSDIQCRQRYVNHLDPAVTKTNWTSEELQILYQKYHEHGNKWYILQKYLPGRTQTKIKNYFYGAIRYLLKIIIKTTSNNTAGFINDIKTDILLDMYEGKNSFHGNTLIKNTINQLQFRVQKKTTQVFVKQHYQTFQSFSKELIQKKLGDDYANIKEEENQSFEHQSNQASPIRTKVQVKKMGEDSQPIKIVCTVNGIANDHIGELEYLSRMVKMHHDWSLFYQKAYDALLEKTEPQKGQRITKQSQ